VLKGLPAGGGPALGDRPRPPLERLVERPSRPAPERAAPPSRLRDAAPPAPAASVTAAPVADAPPPPDAPTTPLDLNRLSARWDDVVEAVRAAGRGIVASALAEATPSDVSGGVVTVQVGSDALAKAIENAGDIVVAAMRRFFTGVQRMAVARAEAASGAQRRMTADDVIARRVAMLRKGAPLLDAAFDALDLRLIE
jgi:DNA polymerase-3 subunit gamma/tau